MRKCFWIAGVITVFSLSACGYTARESFSVSSKRIAVMPFANAIDFQSSRSNIYVPLLEVKAHDALVSQFLFDGTLNVADEQDADLILKGVLTGYDRSALRYNDNDDVQEYRITVTVRLTLQNKEGKTVWEEASFSGEDAYFLSGPQAISEVSAIDQALKDLAKRIVERTVENW